MNAMSNQTPICSPSHQLVCPSTESSAVKVPVAFDKMATILKSEVTIQHAVARPLPANHPLNLDANEYKRTNTTKERTST
jgi:hypothetical protein